jgi:hypothetical protein
MTYVPTGFQEYPQDWAARESLLEPAKKIPSVRKAFTCKAPVSNIPNKRLDAFHALREIGKLWDKTIAKLESEDLASTEMAAAMRSCVPAGYLVKPKNGRFCRHRFCPWCHYRSFRETYVNVKGYLFDTAGKPKYKTITLVSESVDKQKDADIYAQSDATETQEIIRRLKRKKKFSDGLAVMQILPDYSPGSTAAHKYDQYLRFEWNVLGRCPQDDDYDTWANDRRNVRKEMPLTAINLRKLLVEAFPYPALVLTMNTNQLHVFDELTANKKRLRYFGTWKSGTHVK